MSCSSLAPRIPSWPRPPIEAPDRNAISTPRGPASVVRSPCNEQPSICLQPLEALEIIRNAALQIVLRRVTELVARARNIVDAGSGIGHAEEIQPGSDLDVGVRQILADDARDIVERDAYAGADIIDAALGILRRAGEINAVGRILVVDEVVFLVAALREAERQSVGGILHDLAGHAHLAMTRGLARSVGGG